MRKVWPGADRHSIKFRRPAADPIADRRRNEELLRRARNKYGACRLRVLPLIRDENGLDMGLRGQSLTILLPEVVDVYDLWGDVRQFIDGWRPIRTRTPEAQEACRRLLAGWKDLAGPRRL
jgi:hypothetical protein